MSGLRGLLKNCAKQRPAEVSLRWHCKLDLIPLIALNGIQPAMRCVSLCWSKDRENA
jgi:hypothetical protein